MALVSKWTSNLGSRAATALSHSLLITPGDAHNFQTGTLHKPHVGLAMFAKSTRRDRNTSAEVEYTEPLLGTQDDTPADRTIFSVEDSDDELEGTALNTSKSERNDHVRFHEEVQVIGPPLRSTLASREAGEYASSSPFRSLLFRKF
jgi:hypothetical protein